MAHQTMANQAVVEAYLNGKNPPGTTDAATDWLTFPEVPTTEEMRREFLEIDPGVPNNRIKGNWESKEEHLTAQYKFLREESTFALRKAIGMFRSLSLPDEPELKEYCRGAGIYEKAFVTRVTFSKNGLGVRMCFSTFRSRVKIDWYTSKRLTTGSLIAISPANDRFRNTIIMAVVAARPVKLLTQCIPEIDVFFPRSEDTLLDPAQEYIILEETSSFFEAQRHNMLAMQHMIKEKTPLQDYIISPLQSEPAPKNDMDLIELSNMADTLTLNESGIHTVGIPPYVKEDPTMNLTQATGDESYLGFNVVDNPVPQNSPSLDASQMNALHQILTKELALIQGPPGTGKTHVSVEALRVMLDKMNEQRRIAPPSQPVPPLIVACQTNHALDQLLRHIAVFEDSFIRLGGRSKDTGVVRRHTLFEIKESRKEKGLENAMPQASREANRKFRMLENDFRRELAVWEESAGPMTEDSFADYLSEKHIESLHNSTWSNGNSTNDDPSSVPAIVKWLGQNTAVENSKSKWVSGQEFGFEAFEEEDELVDEATIEKAKADDEIEELRGEHISLVDHSIIASSPIPLTETQARTALRKCPDLQKMPTKYRVPLYKFLVQTTRQKIIDKLRDLASEWKKAAERHRVGKFTRDFQILQEYKVIGMTVTGFAKNRPMIYGLRPRIVLIEEAGECLEANMMSLFLPSLQHLILVGDHQQLRPRAQKSIHNAQRYDISLFERLASNTVDYRMLTVQRRMPPEVRRLLWPIYGNRITDHESTLDRPAVPGLGDKKTYFFHHENPETQDKFKSSLNNREAELIRDMVHGLIEKGTLPEKITVLTFYNGQRRLLNRKLRDTDGLGEKSIKVVTVDSYQGDENDIILLSLVRNNFSGTVGFLNVANRVCVALSRARHGLFIFGNVNLLASHGGSEWAQVIDILKGQGPMETRFVKDTRIINCDG